MNPDFRRSLPHWNAFARLDRRVTLAVRRLHSPRRDRWVGRLTVIGSQYFLIPVSIFVATALLLSRRGGSAAFLGAAMLFGWMWSPLLKRRFRRRRPDLWPALATEPSHSFPSGHATMSTIFFGGLSIALGRLGWSPVARMAVGVGCVFVVALVALSRVYLGAHWLSDVLAGILLGSIWLAACLLAERTLLTRRSEGADGRRNPPAVRRVFGRAGLEPGQTTDPLISRALSDCSHPFWRRGVARPRHSSGRKSVDPPQKSGASPSSNF